MGASKNTTLAQSIPWGAERIVSTSEATFLLGISRASLQRLRSNGGGPRFVKLGKRKVAYRMADLEEWLDSRAAISTADVRVRGLA